MVIKYLIGRTAGGSAKSTEFMSPSTMAESRRVLVWSSTAHADGERRQALAARHKVTID